MKKLKVINKFIMENGVYNKDACPTLRPIKAEECTVTEFDNDKFGYQLKSLNEEEIVIEVIKL